MQGVIDPTEMKNRVLAYLTAHPDVEFMLACGATAAEPALAALDELGLAGKVKIGTFDLSPAILQAIVDGKMEWGIDAQQYADGLHAGGDVRPLKPSTRSSPIADYPTGPGLRHQGRRRLR